MNWLFRAFLVTCMAAATSVQAQVKISDLPAATNVAGSQFVIVQDGQTRRIGEPLVRSIGVTNISGLGPFATRTNLMSADVSDFGAAVTNFAPPTTNASLLTTGTLPDGRLGTNVWTTTATNTVAALNNTNTRNAVLGQLGLFYVTNRGTVTVASRGVLDAMADGVQLSFTYGLPNLNAGNWRGALGLGPWATLTNQSWTNVTNFSAGVAANLPAGIVTAGTNGTVTAPTNFNSPAWLLSPQPTNGVATIATNQNGIGWDENGRYTLQSPVGALQLYYTGDPSVPTFYWPGKIVSQSFDALVVNGVVYAKNIVGGSNGGIISQPVMSASMTPVLNGWQGPTPLGSGVNYRTNSNNMVVPVTGKYFPYAQATTNDDSYLEGNYMDKTNFLSYIRTNIGTPYSGAAPTNAVLVADGAGGSAFVAPASMVTTLVLATNEVKGPGWTNTTANLQTNRLSLPSVSLESNSIYRVDYMMIFSASGGDTGLQMSFVTPENPNPPGSTIGQSVNISGSAMYPVRQTASLILLNGGATQQPATNGRGQTGYFYVYVGTNTVNKLSFGWAPTNPASSNVLTMHAGSMIKVTKESP